jgi:hypothetical protein
MVKRIVGLIVVALLCFYVAWPAWSGYTIRTAVQDSEPDRLAAKVDFEQVRERLRPVVTQKVEEGFERYQTQLGATGTVILGQLRKDVGPKIVDASLKALLTPQMIIRIAHEGGSIKESLDRIMREQIGRGLPAGGTPAAGDAGTPAQGLGGLIGKALGRGTQPAAGSDVPATVPAPASGRRKYSLANIKSFGFGGPLSFRVGVARDVAAAEPDLTVEMSFTGGDWKVTGLIPRA